ncbi:hypothetical protein F5878DRAFT_177776 [Lentinula raphanica]|uniref:DUF6534 domain-containing protein n=1 Tax=Lentinula raphanica TaxID=153919 RepID=A0AA38UDX4_9AGAR|nr:hypothetical protein F5878DRAFT_177776 [Lentinula raphanica]
MSLIEITAGVAFAGCLVAVGLSAILGFQVFLYFRIFASDKLTYKILVGWIWAIDATHTVLLCITIWTYLVVNFGNYAALAKITSTAAGTILMTVVTAFSVNGFYGWRLYKMSKCNWWLVLPIAFLSLGQLALGLMNTIVCMKTAQISSVSSRFRITFLMNLSVSVAIDTTISVARYFYMRKMKLKGLSPTQEIVDGIVLFTINDGVATCAVSIASFVSILLINDNFIFMSLYFIISKLYSNSVLATLNLRNWYRHKYPRNRPLGLSMIESDESEVRFREPPSSILSHLRVGDLARKHLHPGNSEGKDKPVEVYLERQVESDIGDSDFSTVDKLDGRALETD